MILCRSLLVDLVPLLIIRLFVFVFRIPQLWLGQLVQWIIRIKNNVEGPRSKPQSIKAFVLDILPNILPADISAVPIADIYLSQRLSMGNGGYILHVTADTGYLYSQSFPLLQGIKMRRRYSRYSQYIPSSILYMNALDAQTTCLIIWYRKCLLYFLLVFPN